MQASRLEANPDLHAARRTLAEYTPRDADQAAIKARILAFIEAHPKHAHLRSCLPGHLTASALLWDHAGERVLLTLHAKLKRWLQFGGHCDGDANLHGVAWRETVEESGIVPSWMSLDPVDVDIHSIPAHKRVPEHLHLDVRYLARASEGAQFVCSDESQELRWFTPAEALELDLDPSLRRIFELPL